MASGSFDLTRTSGTQYLKVWLEWSSTSDVSSNSSSVTVSMKAKRTNTGYTTYGSGTFKITINGVETSINKSYSIGSNEVTLMTATQNVTHNNDGTKSITISGTYTGDSPIGGNGSQSVTLDTIARASNPTLSATSVAMGSNLTITTNRASSNFTHKLFYTFGSLTKQSISTGITTSYTWTVPLTLANQVPNATSGVCTLILETYNGNILIGSVTKTVTLTVPASVVPTVSSLALTEATNRLASQFGVLVQNKSTLNGTITASGSYGSTITTYKTVINNSTYSSRTFTTGTLQTAGTNTAVVTVTDSRGRTASKNVTFSVTAYSKPSITTFTTTRNDNTPTTVSARVKANITNVNNKNTYSYIVKYKKTSASSYSSQTITGTTSVDTTINITGIDENSSYEFILEVKDYFTTITSRRLVSTAFTLIDFNVSGKGLSFGKASEESEALEVGIESHFKNTIYVRNPITQNVEACITPTAIRLKDSNGKQTATINNLGVLQVSSPSSDSSSTIANDFANIGGNTTINGNLTVLGQITGNNIEETIWNNSNGKKINTSSNSSITLTGMPNLTPYANKKINFYVGYSNDMAKVFSFIINKLGTGDFFLEYVRNYSGPDIWHTNFSIQNTNSTSWKVGTGYSYVINNGNIENINPQNLTFNLYKVTIN